MSPVGGALKRLASALVAAALALGASGCVREAVLENDVARAERTAAVLSTQSDLELAEAALGSALVELEALHQRAPRDERILGLLVSGYARWADGFVEARRLEALVDRDAAAATHHAERQKAARARRDAYGKLLGAATPASPGALDPTLADAESACAAHDRARYESRLTALLARRPAQPSGRLDLALSQRLAQSLLMPELSARCQFVIAPTAAPVPATQVP